MCRIHKNLLPGSRRVCPPHHHYDPVLSGKLGDFAEFSDGLFAAGWCVCLDSRATLNFCREHCGQPSAQIPQSALCWAGLIYRDGHWFTCSDLQNKHVASVAPWEKSIRDTWHLWHICLAACKKHSLWVLFRHRNSSLGRSLCCLFKYNLQTWIRCYRMCVFNLATELSFPLHKRETGSMVWDKETVPTRERCYHLALDLFLTFMSFHPLWCVWVWLEWANPSACFVLFCFICFVW